MTKLCVSCKVLLNGVLDTFGEPGEEMCQGCWLSLVEAMQPEPPAQDWQPQVGERVQIIKPSSF